MKQRLSSRGTLDKWISNSVSALEDSGFSSVQHNGNTITASADGGQLRIDFSKEGEKIILDIDGPEKLINIYKSAVASTFKGQPVQKSFQTNQCATTNNVNPPAPKQPNVNKIQTFRATARAGYGFEVDENSKRWLARYKIGHQTFESIYNYSDIVSYDLMEDGTTVVSGGVGRAVVGGILFGGVGAVVGGVTGKKQQKQFCEMMQVKITVNNLKSPTIYIPFVQRKIRTSSSKYRDARDMAQQCLSMLEIICKQAESQPKNINNQNHVQTQATPVQVETNTPTVATSKNPWYASWFMWLMLIFFSPVGIGLMWAFRPDYSQKKKIIISIVAGIWFIYAMVAGRR